MVANSTCSSNSSTLLVGGKEDELPHNSSMITYQSNILPTLRQNLEYLEVDYRNITSLYVSIEDCDWEAVSEKCKHFPDEVRTWVVSGSEGKCSFSWCVWRRLPLHEACRRQPPLQVVQDLLHVFPESANEKTQFGELPLHLAAGCGASWNVVNLLLAHNPWAVAVPDGGGSRPVDLVQSGGMSAECEVIMEALTNCDKMILAGNRKINTIIDQMKYERKEEVDELKRAHGMETKNQNRKISLLKESAEKSRSLINDLVGSVNLCEERIMEKNETEEKLMSRVSDLERDNSELRVYIQKLKGIIAKVEVERDEKKRRIYDLNEVMTKMVNEMDLTMNKQKNASNKSELLEKEIEQLLNKQKANTLDIIKERENIKSVSIKAVREAQDILNKESMHNITIDECSIASTPSVFTPVSESNASLPFTPPKLQTKSTVDHLIDMKERRKDRPTNDNDNIVNIINALSEISPIPKDCIKEHSNNARMYRQSQQLPPRFPHVINGSNGEDMANISAFSTFTEDEDDEVLQLHQNHHNADPKFIDFSKVAPPISPLPPNM